jgi:hypothetical protein
MPFLNIGFKRCVDFCHRWDLLLLHTQIVADKKADVVFGTFLDFVPVFLIELGLLFCRQPHQNKISDFVALAQCKAGRVKTFKNELRIIVMIERNIDDFQLGDS